MSHDIEAAWVAAELASQIQSKPVDFMSNFQVTGPLSVYAARESARSWPIADGVIQIDSGTTQYSIALEFKREEEGTHGVLTAVGQSVAYIHKGHAASMIVVPKSYISLGAPGDYIAGLFDHVATQLPVGVVTYDEPDPSKLSPFQGRLACARKLAITATTPAKGVRTGRIDTQWAHIREGSSTPDVFYRYLQVARNLDPLVEPVVKLPKPLEDAATRLRPDLPSAKTLSNAPGNASNDIIWRNFWFKYVLTTEVADIWQSTGPYVVSAIPTSLLQADGTNPMEFWSSRADSVKNKLVTELNKGAITETQAWDAFVSNVHNRAHSFREDIDSGLEHVGLLDASSGRPTDLGLRFVGACERAGRANASQPLALLRAAVIQHGQYGALIHYMHRLSEQRFRSDPLAFTILREAAAGRTISFDAVAYIDWIAEQLSGEMRVMRTVSKRGGAQRGTERRPLQAEMTMLAQLGLVPSGKQRFRTGTGLVIDWPSVQEASTVSV